MYETKKQGGNPVRIREVIRKEYPWIAERIERIKESNKQYKGYEKRRIY